MKKRLIELDRLIASFEQLVRDFPEAREYRDILEKLSKERAELTSKIGR